MLAKIKLPRALLFLGPGFIAATAYVDPGNVASNISAGVEYQYLLLWVLVIANIIAGLIQYQSAKLGLATGYSLPALIGARVTNKYGRVLYWLQAEFIAIVTDFASIIGGAFAVEILCGIRIDFAIFLIGCISFLILTLQKPPTQRLFEIIIIAFLAVISLGFVIGVILDPPPLSDVLSGLIPRIKDHGSLLLAASLVGATVMPHTIYLHSQMVLDRFGKQRTIAHRIPTLLKATKYDVGIALSVAGLVNISLLLLAAHSLTGAKNTDSIEGAYYAIAHYCGPLVAVAFIVSLLISGLAATSVGAYAGATVMDGLLHCKNTQKMIYIRRILTIVPAMILVQMNSNTTQLLVDSQIVLSCGIPAVLIPLTYYTTQKKIMGCYADSTSMKIIIIAATSLIITLNLAIIYFN